MYVQVPYRLVIVATPLSFYFESLAVVAVSLVGLLSIMKCLLCTGPFGRLVCPLFVSSALVLLPLTSCSFLVALSLSLTLRLSCSPSLSVSLPSLTLSLVLPLPSLSSPMKDTGTSLKFHPPFGRLIFRALVRVHVVGYVRNKCSLHLSIYETPSPTLVSNCAPCVSAIPASFSSSVPSPPLRLSSFTVFHLSSCHCHPSGHALECTPQTLFYYYYLFMPKS